MADTPLATETVVATGPAKAAPPTGEILLHMSNISKAYPGVQALSNANFEVGRGEIHGLVGKNGAGKSTLVGVLMGITAPDSGTITIGNETIRHPTPQAMLDAGVAYVPQHVKLLSTLTVAENILVGDLPKNKVGFVSWKRVFSDSQERLEKLGLKLDVHQRVEGLSVAEQTMLAIAKALFSNARLIILDEPTASLPRKDINLLFSFVRSLQNQGVAFIYISHHLEEVFEICDRVTVMRDGKVVGTNTVSEINISGLIEMMVGGVVEDYARTSAIEGAVVFQVEGLSRRGEYEGINLTLHRKEVVGLSGLEGSGVGTLAKALFGLERYGIGTISIEGKPFTARTPKESFEQGVAYLPQDRHRYGLVQLRPVRENVTYSVLDRIVGPAGVVPNAEEKELTAEYINKLGIVTPSQEQKAQLLSGGNQQKVVFARLAATKPTVLILHEPTQGVDVQAKVDIFNIISDLSDQGVAILIISSEVRELVGLCDRILVMYEGKITREFTREAGNMKPEEILLAIEGGGHNGETS